MSTVHSRVKNVRVMVFVVFLPFKTPTRLANTVVHAFISSCLDYCNSLVVGITDNLNLYDYRPHRKLQHTYTHRHSKVQTHRPTLRFCDNNSTGCQYDSE